MGEPDPSSTPTFAPSLQELRLPTFVGLREPRGRKTEGGFLHYPCRPRLSLIAYEVPSLPRLTDTFSSIPPHLSVLRIRTYGGTKE